LYGDNAGIAFNQDGTQVACVSGYRASLWEVACGRQLGDWRLPRGIIDKIAFDQQGRLITARREGTKGNYKCVVRDLLANDGQTPLCTIDAFPSDIYSIVLSYDGSLVVIEGHDKPSAGQCWIRVYATSSGELLWELQLPNKTSTHCNLALDPLGKFLVFTPGKNGDDPTRTIVAMPTGDLVAQNEVGIIPGPEARLFVSHGPEIDAQYWRGRLRFVAMLCRRGQDTPLVSFLRGIECESAVFSSDGRLIASGRPDGTVGIYDIEQIRLRLTKFSMGW
jgi:WD40 repeat protein